MSGAAAIGMAGVSYRDAPLALLDRLAYRPVEVPAALARLLAASGARRAAILATCNRVEVYTSFAGPPDAAALAGFLARDRAWPGTPAGRPGRPLPPSSATPGSCACCLGVA